MNSVGRPARWPWAILALFFALATAAMVGVAVNGESLAEQVPFLLAFSMFGVVGALVLSRARGNRIGGLLLYGCGTVVVAFAGGELTTYMFERGTTEGVLVAFVALLSELGWLIGILPTIIFLPLLFPDGRLPSPSWRPFAWALVSFLALLGVVTIFGTEVVTGSVEDVRIENPLFIPALRDLFEISDTAISFVLLGMLVASLTSIVVRFRRADGVERQQIKWMALAVLLLVVSLTVSEVLLVLGIESGVLDSLILGPAFLALPVAVGVAVLQFRLYELDVVVRKALVAGTLALFVILVYGAVVGVFGLVAAEGASSGTVFVIALALGLAFRPVTRFARKAADRLVYGRRATPYEVLTEFSGRVGDAYATEDVLGRMAQILGQGTGADRARVWLRVAGELRPAATWSAGAVASDAAAPGDLAGAAGETTVEVRDRGELLGALSVTMPASDPMTPAKERLVHDLASHAGLVLRNVRLVEELRAAQRRLVTAQDQERRRLERNIHDGAQQQLVALSVKARLARALTERDPTKAGEMLSQIEAEVQTALEDLRDLARGIYPPLLADKGLGAALEAQARRSPVSVTVEAPDLGRYPQEVEAAVYFSCLEALQNVAKYAEAQTARVVLTQANGHLSFEVSDDGRGFDAESIGYGTGLRGIADRLAALDGSLVVRSRPSEGTTVSGTVAVDRVRERQPAAG